MKNYCNIVLMIACVIATIPVHAVSKQNKKKLQHFAGKIGLLGDGLGRIKRRCPYTGSKVDIAGLDNLIQAVSPVSEKKEKIVSITDDKSKVNTAASESLIQAVDSVSEKEQKIVNITDDKQDIDDNRTISEKIADWIKNNKYRLTGLALIGAGAVYAYKNPEKVVHLAHTAATHAAPVCEKTAQVATEAWNQVPAMPAIRVPQISMPIINMLSMPTLSMPSISIPKLSLPSIPTLHVPTIRMPQFSMLSMPKLSMPSIRMPQFSMPSWFSGNTAA